MTRSATEEIQEAKEISLNPIFTLNIEIAQNFFFNLFFFLCRMISFLCHQQMNDGIKVMIQI